jgi:AcrR family transcriptional regulator
VSFIEQQEGFCMATARRVPPRGCADARSSAASARGRNVAGRPADRRVRRTRELLHKAIGELIQEKSYDLLTVSDILKRANVGRSAFYSHFCNKDELLASCISELLALWSSRERLAGSGSGVTRFSLPLLTHIDGHVRTARIGPRARAVLHEHLRHVLAGHVDREAAGDRPAHIPPGLLGDFVATTFIVVLRWWLDRHGQDLASPEDADEVFRALVAPASEGSQAPGR